MASSQETNFSIQTEIESLKNIGNCSVKVLENIGEYKVMIILKNKLPEFAIRFHFSNLNEPFPMTILLCKHASSDQISKLQAKLSNISKKTLSLLHIFETAKNDLTLTLPANNETSTSKLSNKNSKREKKSSKRAAELDSNGDLVVEKKASMKTAMDVVNRILWDDSIPKDQMTIGYLDRFLGVLEKPFFSFSWEDIASVDYYTFAIPKHRIVYFKYRKAKVWDKELRLDNVFGSAGSQVTIHEVISNYKPEDYPDEDVIDRYAGLHNASNDSDEDDVEFVVGPNSAPPPISRTSSIILTEDEDDDLESKQSLLQNLDSEKKTYWQDKLRPNFFICFQITNTEIKSMVSHIQDVVCQRQPLYEECCTPEDLLHVTLCTLRLDTPDQVSECLEVIRSYADELRSLLPKSPLLIKGLDRFFGRVLYAKVIADQSFFNFVQHLETVLRAAGMPLTDNHEFVPHMSIIKVSRPVTKRLGTKTISPLIYYGSENIEFGEQSIDSIYLCSMEKTRGADGFYVTPGNITFKKSVL